MIERKLGDESFEVVTEFWIIWYRDGWDSVLDRSLNVFVFIGLENLRTNMFLKTGKKLKNEMILWDASAELY
jgi:hypothetical protein